MNYQLLVLDIDGTVTNSQKIVTPRTREALIHLQEKGIPVAIASGRPYQGIAPIADVLEFQRFGSYILAFNGGRIMNWKTKEVIYSKTLPMGLPRRLQKDALEHGVGIIAYSDHDTVISGGASVDRYIQLESNICNLPIEISTDYAKDIPYPINKCLFTGEPDDIATLEPILYEKYLHEAQVFRSEDFYLEVTPKNVDKAYCLARLLDILGISRDAMVCCGDGYNDLTMLQFAGLGVAMANAKEEVLKVADYITASNDHDGVALVVEKFFLQNSF